MFDFLNIERHELKNIEPKNQRKYKELDRQTYNMLLERYKEDNQELIQLLGENFTWG